jgi:methyl-accepting chemotaxis protein
MLKNLSIGSRVLMGSALVSVLTISVLLPVALSRLSALSDQAERRELEDQYFSLTSAIAAQGAVAQALSAVVAHIPAVQQAFATGDRPKLQAMTSPVFDYMEKHQAVKQFQFLAPPATSFLRVHMLERHGDDLSAIRKTVVEANRTRQPVKGLEYGVAGLGVRGMEPVSYEGRHVGVVEFGMSFGQPFFDRFKTGAGIDVALQIPDGEKFKTFGGTIEGGSLLSRDQLERIIKGEVLTERVDYRGAPTTVYGRLVNDFSGQPVGVLELAINRAEAVGAFRNALAAMLGLGALLLAGGLALAWITARSIARPIRQTVEGLVSIAEGDGDLTRRLPQDGRNELADLGRAFNAFVDKIHNMVRLVAGASAQLAAAAEELSVTSGETNRQVTDEQRKTDQVAAAIHEMTTTVEQVARHATQAASVVQDAHREARSGDALAQQAVEAIETLAREIEQTREVVTRLADDSREIGAVLDVIRGVAEQTNLLALNAAIEAARAGEQGRGFAVVADEVRTLASRTQSSIEDIRNKIERVQTGSASVVQATSKSGARARESVDSARRASDAFKNIGQLVESVSDMNTQIASAAEQQSAVAEEINRNVHTIAATVNQTASGSEHLAQASGDLARLAVEIKDLIAHFDI